MFLIKTENLSHTYMDGSPFKVEAVKNINITIKEGEIVGIIGATGSGKSTLIQHFNGILAPSAGKVFVLGQDINDKKTDLKNIRRDIGLLFQYPEHQLFEETIYADIAFGPKNMGLPEEETEKRIKNILDIIGITLEESKERSPFSLSGGQMRKVALAGILAMDPKVLVLDEPTAGLDPLSRAEFLNNIKLLNEKYDKTIIMVSHSMEEVAQVATRVIVMNEGEIAADEDIDQIFSLTHFISNLGLDAPSYTKLAYRLKEEGYPVNTNVYTLEQIKEELLKHWNF